MASTTIKAVKGTKSQPIEKKVEATNLVKESTWQYINDRRAKTAKVLIAKGLNEKVKKISLEKKFAKRPVKSTVKVNLLIGENMQPFVVDNDRVAAFAGIDFATFRGLVDYFQLSQEDLCHVFGLSESTYHRRRNANAVFVGQEADAIVRVAEVFKIAEDVFENPEKAHSWMKSPRKYLGGKRPVDLLSSSVGIEAVKSYLNRIDQGIFA